MTKSDNEKILVQDGDTVIELTGEKKEAFLADRKLWAEQELQRQAEAEAKAQAKATAEGKLAALGLTTDDLRALGL